MISVPEEDQAADLPDDPVDSKRSAQVPHLLLIDEWNLREPIDKSVITVA